LIVRNVRSPKTKAKFVEAHLLKLMDAGIDARMEAIADIDTFALVSPVLLQADRSNANSLRRDEHGSRSSYSLTLDQLVRAEALNLSSLAEHVHTREQLCEWVSGPPQPFDAARFKKNMTAKHAKKAR
jgi:hypothetical protein